MCIYTFAPTYLYIKQHSVTGKLYFGKTIKNPEKYPGSGKHWKSHIKVHGKEYVETLWFCLFFDKESIQEFAENFSTQEDIVISTRWLNMKPENGLDGGAVSFGPLSKEHIAKMVGSRGPRGKLPESSKLNMKGNPNPCTIETKLKLSKIQTGRIRGAYKSKIPVECPYCKLVGTCNMTRYHFDNCKFNANRGVSL